MESCVEIVFSFSWVCVGFYIIEFDFILYKELGVKICEVNMGFLGLKTMKKF